MRSGILTVKGERQLHQVDEQDCFASRQERGPDVRNQQRTLRAQFDGEEVFLLLFHVYGLSEGESYLNL